MNNQLVKDELLRLGADIVGFGDLREIDYDVREGFPIGISIAVVYPPEVIRGIAELPTPEYRKSFKNLNDKLKLIAEGGEKFLKDMGYDAVAQTYERIKKTINKNRISKLPHKTIATRAGIGWIGKCALLVTEEYGSAIRISSILTNASLSTDQPINKSKCGNCMICTNECPGGAVIGKEWEAGIQREKIYDWKKCSKTAQERTKLGNCGGIYKTLCGKCIECCPYTRKYIEKAETRKRLTNWYMPDPPGIG